MRKLALGMAVAFLALGTLSGCRTLFGRGRGPLDSFAFLASANPALEQDVAGTIVEQGDPKQVLLVVPPGTNTTDLVATVSLSAEATITVISSGERVVQANGVTPNDFSVSVLYAIEVAGEKEPWRYRVSVREADTDAALAQLAFPEGYTLQPSFSPATRSYAVEVPYATRTVQMELRARSRYLTSITVAGRQYRGSSARAGVEFSEELQRGVSIETLAEDGRSTESYNIVIRRGEPDRNAALATLEIDAGPLAPGFSPERLGYRVVVPYAAAQFTVRARPQSGLATVTLLQAPAGGGGSAQMLPHSGNLTSPDGAAVAFRGGDRMGLVVAVTAQDGSMQEYLVEVVRAAADRNSRLATLTVDGGAVLPAFAPNREGYAYPVPFAARQVTVQAQPQSPFARVRLQAARSGETISYTGNPASSQGAVLEFSRPGRQEILVVVTAQDGSVSRYVLSLQRAEPDRNANLETLLVSRGTLTPAFSPRIVSYVLSLPGSAGSVELSASAASPVATVAVADQPALSPARQQAVSVAVEPGGASSVSFVVTAQDGSQRLYRVAVRREALPQASGQTVAPAGGAGQGGEVAAGGSGGTASTGGGAAQAPGGGPTSEKPRREERAAGIVTVSARNLRLADREAAALGGEAVGQNARVTVRVYRTERVLAAETVAVQARRRGKTWAVTLGYRSPRLDMDAGQPVEIEVVIPTAGGRSLYYVEARWPEEQIEVEVPFLLYGGLPQSVWPPVGKPVAVAGYVSLRGRESSRQAEEGEREFPRNEKGEYRVDLEISDPGTGKVLAAEQLWRKPGLGRPVAFGRTVELPEGAFVRYALTVTASNGRLWRAGGTTQVWTMKLAYPGGYEPALLQVSGALSPGRD